MNIYWAPTVFQKLFKLLRTQQWMNQIFLSLMKLTSNSYFRWTEQKMHHHPHPQEVKMKKNEKRIQQEIRIIIEISKYKGLERKTCLTCCRGRRWVWKQSREERRRKEHQMGPGKPWLEFLGFIIPVIWSQWKVPSREVTWSDSSF